MQHKKSISNDDIISKAVQDTISDFLASLKQTKKNSGRINGDIPDVSEYIKTLRLIDESLLEDGFKQNEDPVNYIVRKYSLMGNQVVVKQINNVNIISLILPNNIDKNILGSIKHDLQSYDYFNNRTPRQISNINYFVTVFESSTNKKPPRNRS